MTFEPSRAKFLAKDVYPTWKKAIKAATDNIALFTPFYNNTLLRLLGNANIDSKSVTIVTDFKPEYLLLQPGQLIATKRLLEQGHVVKHLPKLHSKVLLCDNQYLVLGSQNFTSAGRANKECGAITSYADTDVYQTLSSWMRQGQLIELKLVLELLRKLKHPVRQINKIFDEWQIEFEKASWLVEADAEREREARRTKLVRQTAQMEKRSRIRYTKGALWAEIKESSNGGYWSLETRPNEHFTKWILKDSKGTSRQLPLAKIKYYPMFIVPNSQLVFGRVCHRVVTFFRNYSTSTRITVDMHEYSVSLRFPTSETESCNCEFVVRSAGLHMWAIIPTYFDLVNIQVVRNVYFEEDRYMPFDKTSPLYQGFIMRVHQPSFISQFPFRLAMKKLLKAQYRGSLYEKNVRQYLDKYRYRVSLVQFEGEPVITMIDSRTYWSNSDSLLA